MIGPLRAFATVGVLMAAAPAWAETAVVQFVVGEAELTLEAGTQVSAVLTSDGNGDKQSVNFRLPEAFVQPFGELTTQYLGETMDLMVCGEVLTQPRIMAPILSANLQITGLEPEQARQVAQILARGYCE